MHRGVGYPHLELIDWPFRLVPDESFYSFMADRAQLISDIRMLLRGRSRQPASSMHLLWAWFGAGKTHTLRHMEYLCRTEFTNIVPVYIEFPKSVRNFLDVYRAFIGRIDMGAVSSAYLEVFTNPEADEFRKELRFDFPDLFNALMLLYQGSQEQQDIVIRWLRTEYHQKRILKDVGVVRPIKSAGDAVEVMSWLIRLINWAGTLSGETRSVLWMIDEYQRIEQVRRPAIDEINGCLHSVFNKCPNGLSIIISFSGYPEERRLPSWLSPEIKDRIGVEKPLLLPPLLTEECVEFVKDVLLHFRNPVSAVPEKHYPFTTEAIGRAVEIIEGKAKKSRRIDQPKPRTIMQFFNLILQRAELLIEGGEMEVIDEEFASMVLEDVHLPEE